MGSVAGSAIGADGRGGECCASGVVLLEDAAGEIGAGMPVAGEDGALGIGRKMGESGTVAGCAIVAVV